jgi:hypothetical protein
VSPHYKVQFERKLSWLGEAGPLIVSRERDQNLVVSQGSLYGRLDRQDLTESLFLRWLVDAGVTTEDDVDDVVRVLKPYTDDLSSLSSSLSFFFVFLSGIGAFKDLRRVTHSNNKCLNFGCIGHCLCRSLSNSSCLFPCFFPRGVRSISATRSSGLRFWKDPE